MTSVGSISWRWMRAALAFGCWLLLGTLFGAQFYFSAAKAGSAIGWMQALSFALGDWYAFAVLSPAAVALSRNYPLSRTRWWRALAVHLPASVVFSVAYMVVRAGVAQFQGWAAGQPTGFADAFRPLLIKTWHFNALIYWVIAAVTHALLAARELRERERRALELEKRLAEARLQALQMQLNPHFLFNALNSVAALMHRDVEAADATLVRLGALLRRALDNSARQEVPLGEELAFLRQYLEIEQARFGSRLVTRSAFDSGMDEALVPNLLLQPLVENAIKHGLEPQAHPVLITLRGGCDADRLWLEVSDNGAGWKTNASERVGLANTRARLSQLYGADHTFEIIPGAESGVRVRVVIPYRSVQKSRGESKTSCGPGNASQDGKRTLGLHSDGSIPS